AEEKKNTRFDDVFRKWIVNDPNGGDSIYTQNDEDGLGDPVFFCQSITVSGSDDATGGTKLIVDREIDTAPYLPTAKISRVTAWPVGASHNAGWGSRTTEQKLQPEYKPPMFFNLGEDGKGFVDLTKEQNRGQTFYINDRGVGLNLKANYGHIYALKELGGDGPEFGEEALFYWQANAFTFALESSQ